MDSTYAFTDCSGFLNGLFQHVYGIDRDALHQWLGVDARKSGPTANRYYAAITEQRGFVRITKIADIRPGDVIAILYPDDRRNTGHVMLARAVSKKIDPISPRAEHMEQRMVSVIDSSASPHGRNDSRWREREKHQTGLGKGFILIYVSAEGEISGYSWASGGKSKIYMAIERPIAAGRFTGLVSQP